MFSYLTTAEELVTASKGTSQESGQTTASEVTGKTTFIENILTQDTIGAGNATKQTISESTDSIHSPDDEAFPDSFINTIINATTLKTVHETAGSVKSTRTESSTSQDFFPFSGGGPVTASGAAFGTTTAAGPLPTVTWHLTGTKFATTTLDTSSSSTNQIFKTTTTTLTDGTPTTKRTLADNTTYFSTTSTWQITVTGTTATSTADGFTHATSANLPEKTRGVLTAWGPESNEDLISFEHTTTGSSGEAGALSSLTTDRILQSYDLSSIAKTSGVASGLTSQVTGEGFAGAQETITEGNLNNTSQVTITIGSAIAHGTWLGQKATTTTKAALMPFEKTALATVDAAATLSWTISTGIHTTTTQTTIVQSTRSVSSWITGTDGAGSLTTAAETFTEKSTAHTTTATNKDSLDGVTTISEEHTATNRNENFPQVSARTTFAGQGRARFAPGFKPPASMAPSNGQYDQLKQGTDPLIAPGSVDREGFVKIHADDISAPWLADFSATDFDSTVRWDSVNNSWFVQDSLGVTGYALSVGGLMVAESYELTGGNQSASEDEHIYMGGEGSPSSFLNVARLRGFAGTLRDSSGGTTATTVDVEHFTFAGNIALAIEPLATFEMGDLPQAIADAPNDGGTVQ